MGVDSNTERTLTSMSLGGDHLADGGHGKGCGSVGRHDDRRNFPPSRSEPNLGLPLRHVFFFNPLSPLGDGAGQQPTLPVV